MKEKDPLPEHPVLSIPPSVAPGEGSNYRYQQIIMLKI